jgi:hypothetical protein
MLYTRIVALGDAAFGTRAAWCVLKRAALSHCVSPNFSNLSFGEVSYDGSRARPQSDEHEIHKWRPNCGHPSGARPAPEAQQRQEDYYNYLCRAGNDSQGPQRVESVCLVSRSGCGCVHNSWRVSQQEADESRIACFGREPISHARTAAVPSLG